MSIKVKKMLGHALVTLILNLPKLGKRSTEELWSQRMLSKIGKGVIVGKNLPKERVPYGVI